MEASEIDWETINANLPFEHNEESHAQRRWLKVDFWLYFVNVHVRRNMVYNHHIRTYLLSPMRRATLREGCWKLYFWASTVNLCKHCRDIIGKPYLVFWAQWGEPARRRWLKFLFLSIYHKPLQALLRYNLAMTK